MKKTWLLPVVYILSWQMTYFLKVSTWIPLLVFLPSIVFFISKYRGDSKAFYSVVFFSIFAVMLVLPSMITKTFHLHFYAIDFVESIAYSLLLSLTLIPLTFSIPLDSGRRNSFSRAILAGLMYFLTITPIYFPYSIQSISRILLFNLGFDVTFGIYISFLYIVSGRKLLSPTIFFVLYSILSFLGISENVNALFNLVWEILAISIIFSITYFTVGQTPSVKKLFKSKGKITISRKVRKADIAFAAIVLVLAVMSAGGYYFHTIEADPTGSMYPVITPGSLLIINPVPPQDVKIGDIIEFHAPWDKGTLYAHMVVGIYSENGSLYFRTRGVANPVDDPAKVPGNEVVGIVTYHIPYLGYLLIYGKIAASVLALGIVGSFLLEGSGVSRRKSRWT